MSAHHAHAETPRLGAVDPRGASPFTPLLTRAHGSRTARGVHDADAQQRPDGAAGEG
jgi:hypothetical protein